jgi:hypothetical protein
MNASETKKFGLVESIFVLCETCHWCATHFDKSRIANGKCIVCREIFPMGKAITQKQKEDAQIA